MEESQCCCGWIVQFCIALRRRKERFLELIFLFYNPFESLVKVAELFCRMLQRAQDTEYINMNCVDPLGRSALLMAIDNENLEMVELLIEYKVDTKDALLHAISEEFVEAVEVLLEHEETIHRNGEPHVRRFALCRSLLPACSMPVRSSYNLYFHT